MDSSRSLLTEIVALREARGSKLIEVTDGELTTTLVIADGELVAARASKPGEPIGRIMRRRGFITQEHYIEILERMSEVLAAGDTVRFGEVAVGLGFAKPEEVSKSLAAQVRGLVARVFQGNTPTWKTLDPPSTRDASRDAPMYAEAIFLDCVRWFDDAHKARLGLGDARDKALRPAWELSDIDVRFELTDEESEFARVALAGDRTVAQLLESKVPDAVDMHSVLTALIAAGAATTQQPGAAQRHDKAAARAAAHEVPLWATVDADSAQRAVVKLKKARHTQPNDGIASLLEQALVAERSFQLGRELFQSDKLEEALPYFARAAEREPSSDEYVLFVDWTRHCLAGTELSPAEGEALVARARLAVLHNPKLAFGYFVLGDVLGAQGKHDEARTQIARALRLDSDLFHGIRERRIGNLRAGARGESATTQRPPSSARHAAAKVATPASPVVAPHKAPASPRQLKAAQDAAGLRKPPSSSRHIAVAGSAAPEIRTAGSSKTPSSGRIAAAQDAAGLKKPPSSSRHVAVARKSAPEIKAAGPPKIPSSDRHIAAAKAAATEAARAKPPGAGARVGEDDDRDDAPRRTVDPRREDEPENVESKGDVAPRDDETNTRDAETDGATSNDETRTGEASEAVAAPAAAKDAKPKAKPAPPKADAAPSRVRGLLLILAGAVLGAGAAVAVVEMRTHAAPAEVPTAAAPDPAAPPAPSPTVSVPAVPVAAGPDSSAPIAAGHDAATSAAAGSSATDAAAAAAVKDAEATAVVNDAGKPGTTTSAASTGVLVLPERARGHRVFIDGKTYPADGLRIEVACGQHQVKVGSRGAARAIAIPCGGVSELH